MASLLSVALSGLNAAQAGMTTTSHNISNANVDGFSRQRIEQGTQDPMVSGAGYFGQGTRVDTVKRMYSQFLENQVLGASSAKAQFETYSNEIKQVDSLLGNETSGVSAAMENFFTAVDQVSATPSNIAARQALVSSAQSLAASFQAVGTRMEEVRSGVEGQIAQSATDVTAYARQIADLNRQIALAQAASPNGDANDLLDERSRVVAQLNQEIKVTIQAQGDGSINVFVGSGQPLVVGLAAFAMTAGPSSEDPSRSALSIGLPGGARTELPESVVTGGKLGGLLTFRSDALDQAENALGRVAAGLVSTVNAQHQLGQDLDGLLGGNFFTPLSPTVQGLPGAGSAAPTAALSAAVTNAGALGTDDYILSYDGSNYAVTNVADGTVTSSASLANLVPGITLSIASGGVAAGDRFLIQPTRYAARDISVAITDPRMVAAGAPFATSQTSSNTGTGAIDLSVANSTTGFDANGDRIADFPRVTLTFSSATNQFLVSQTIGATTYTGTFSYNPLSDAAGLKVDLGSVTMAPGGASIPDIAVTLSGVPANGDSFSIATNAGGVSDGRNALALGNLQVAKTLVGGGASYQAAYAQLVSEVGVKASSASVNAEAQESYLTQATASQQSLSGVNLDEEAANLIRYQQAYQASARVLSVASKLFDDILSIMG